MNLTRHNYEEYFMLYIDNELKEEECAEVQQFIKENPDLGEELRTLQKAILDPEEVYTFADKTSLFRHEAAKSASIVPLWKRRIPAAAAILLLVSGSIWLWKENTRPGSSMGAGHTIAGKLPANGERQPGGGNSSSQVTPQKSSADATIPDTLDPLATGGSASRPSGNSVLPGSAGVLDHANPSVVSPASIAPSGSPIPGSSGPIQGLSGDSGGQDHLLASGTGVIPGIHQNAPDQKMAGTVHPTNASNTSIGQSGDAIAQKNDNIPLSAAQPNLSQDARPAAASKGTGSPSAAITSTTTPKNNPGSVTTSHTPSYHTLEDADQTNDDNTILFVRADQVMNSGVKGFFRKAGRAIKRSASLNTDNVHAEPDAER